MFRTRCGEHLTEMFQRKARPRRPLCESIILLMHVDPERYRVIPRWRAFWWLLAVLLFFWVPLWRIIVWLDGHGWWQGYVTVPLITFVFGIWGINYGVRVLRDGIAPPLRAWVVEGWRVLEGRSARIFGWVFIALAAGSLLLTIRWVRLLYDISQSTVDLTP